jgi:hypothetical protein
LCCFFVQKTQQGEAALDPTQSDKPWGNHDAMRIGRVAAINLAC